MGRHLYATCPDCAKVVRLTGWFARWHLCLTDEEKAARDVYAAQMRAQQHAPPVHLLSALGQSVTSTPCPVEKTIVTA